VRLRIEEVITNVTPQEIKSTILTIAPFDQASTAIPKAIGTAKGDLVGFSASATPVRVPAPSTDGQVLMADSAETAGMKWAGGVGGSKLLTFMFGDGISAIVPDTMASLTWLLSVLTLEEWEVIEVKNNTGYIEFLLCVDSYANAPAGPADDIVGVHLGGTRPKLNSAVKAQSTAVDFDDKTVAHAEHLVVIASGYLGALTFSGAGLDDMEHGRNSRFTLGANVNYKVEIDGVGSPNTFRWSDDGGSTWDASTVSITGADQALNNGVTIRFAATTGHTSTNSWSWTARAITAKQVHVTLMGSV
jgi:hypothetical protein